LARRAGTHRATKAAQFLPYLVLLRVGFAMPRTLLPGRCALTAPFHPYRGLAAEAVYSLWHFPSNALEGAVPDVIRHVALWSSDFPLSFRAARANPAFTEGQRPSDLASANLYYRMERSAEWRI